MLLETAKFIRDKLATQYEEVTVHIILFPEGGFVISFETIFGDAIRHQGTMCRFVTEEQLNNFADTL